MASRSYSYLCVLYENIEFVGAPGCITTASSGLTSVDIARCQTRDNTERNPFATDIKIIESIDFVCRADERLGRARALRGFHDLEYTYRLAKHEGFRHSSTVLIRVSILQDFTDDRLQ